MKIIYKQDVVDGKLVCIKYTDLTNFEFQLQMFDSEARIKISSNGSTINSYSFSHAAGTLNDGLFHTFTFIFTPNLLETWFDEEAKSSLATTESSIYTGNGNLYISSPAAVPFVGSIACFKVNDIIDFKCAQGGTSNKLLNSGTGGDATVINADLTEFYSGKQDEVHWNYKEGFDLYENGTPGEELYAPIGATVTDVSYTFTASYPAQIGLNNCESEIEFDAALSTIITAAGVPNPLSYDEFETDFNSIHQVYSCLANHKSILFYNPALSVANSNRLLKCFAKGSCLELAKNEAGEYVVDEDGNYVEED